MNIDKVTRQFIKLNLASLAFTQVRNQAQHIIDSNFAQDSLLLTPHMAGLVVTYAKNFTESEGIGPLPKQYEEFTDSSLEHTHNMLIGSRHKLYAHRDFTAAKSFNYDDINDAEPYEVAIVFHEKGGCATCFPSIPEVSPDILPLVISLCDFQIARIVKEVKEKVPILVKAKSPEFGIRYILGKDYP